MKYFPELTPWEWLKYYYLTFQVIVLKKRVVLSNGHYVPIMKDWQRADLIYLEIEYNLV